MIWLRKGFGLFFSLILFLSLVAGVSSFAFNLSFGTPAKVKTWLAESKIYDSVVSAALNSSQDDGNSDGSVDMKDPVVQQAAKQAFSSQLLQQSANTFIDANYAWLNGKTSVPQFKIDLSVAKDDFATRVGKAVETHLAGLTVCTAQQQAQLQIPVNSLTVTCRPAVIDPKTEGARVTQEIKTSDFLNNPVLTADNLNQNSNDPSAKAYYVSASKAPQVFRLQQKSPIAFALLAILSATAIIFILVTRRKGWRRVGSVLLFTGILLSLTKIVADIGVNKIENMKLTGTLTQLEQPRKYLLDAVEAQLTKTSLYFGIAFIVIALIIYGVLYKTREGSNKPKAPKPAPEAPLPTQDPFKQSPPARNTPPAPTPAAKPGAPAYKTPKPKKPRPPRLIQ